MKKVRYMISDAAAMMHVESHVLRYWEEELELDVPRNEMGHRYYTEENIHQFEQIKKWKEEGYQLKAIKMMLHSDNPELLEQEQEMQSQHLKLVPDQETVPDKDLSHTLPAKTQETKESMNQTVPAGMSKLEQFQLMMNDIVRNAIAENNQSLGQAVSEHVGEKVIKEMNYLMREQEEQEEERFRKLDEAIRSRQKNSRRKEEKANRKELKKSRREFRKKKKQRVRLQPGKV